MAEIDKILLEKYVDITIDDIGDYGYTINNFLVDDSIIRHFIDIKYDAEDVINLAKQIDEDIKGNEINKAYETIIDGYDEVEGIKDIDELRKYLEEAIADYFYDEVEADYYEQEEANQEIDDFERSHMWDDRF